MYDPSLKIAYMVGTGTTWIFVYNMHKEIAIAQCEVAKLIQTHRSNFVVYC